MLVGGINSLNDTNLFKRIEDTFDKKHFVGLSKGIEFFIREEIQRSVESIKK